MKGIESTRLPGWLLAALLLLHLLLLREASDMLLAAAGLIFVGGILRAFRICAPSWVEVALAIIAAAWATAIRGDGDPRQLLGGLACLMGAIFLLRPITPARGLSILLCILATLTAITLQRDAPINAVFIIVDVMVMLTLAQEVHRPPEAALGLLASLLRSLRLAIPVGFLIAALLWLFPSLSTGGDLAFTGFGGGDVLDPGEAGEVRPSSRVAFVAKFPVTSEVPPAGDLYWRGSVLEKNEGLRWRRDPSRSQVTMQGGGLAQGTPSWHYAQGFTPGTGGILPALDRPLSISATREGRELTVINLGASTFMVADQDRLSLSITSSHDGPADAPLERIAGGDLAMPPAISASREMGVIAGNLIDPARGTRENLEAIAAFLRNPAFGYSMSPGKMDPADVAGFLTDRRKGFCEHYAAASANILRLGGVPARVVTGYRGGEWNPWLRTLTVRESDAHAWVEAWDAPSGRWLRFDPTASVAPGLSERLRLDRDPARWPWYRLAGSLARGAFIAAGEYMENALSGLWGSGMRDALQIALPTAITLAGIAWLALRAARHPGNPDIDIAGRELAKLERIAKRYRRARLRGETPLAWLARLAETADGDTEIENLRQFSTCYEAAVYRSAAPDTPLLKKTETAAKRLMDSWRHPPKNLHPCGNDVLSPGLPP